MTNPKELEKDQLMELTDQEQFKIRDFLIANHQPLARTMPPSIPRRVAEEVIDIVQAQPVPELTKSPQATAHQHNSSCESQQLVECELVAHEHSCRHCSSSNIKVVYGQYGYYFKCTDCDSNTKIDFTCRCGEKAKISKRRNRFNWKCDCGNDDLFFENKE